MFPVSDPLVSRQKIELLALLENLRGCASLRDGPPARRVPEAMCSEMEDLLERLVAVDNG